MCVEFLKSHCDFHDKFRRSKMTCTGQFNHGCLRGAQHALTRQFPSSRPALLSRVYDLLSAHAHLFPLTNSAPFSTVLKLFKTHAPRNFSKINFKTHTPSALQRQRILDSINHIAGTVSYQYESPFYSSDKNVTISILTSFRSRPHNLC